MTLMTKIPMIIRE